MSKPILCLDFDGVCHSYTSGWQGADIIPDPPVKGLFEFLEQANEVFEIHIFSSRSNQLGGITAMKKWFAKHCENPNFLHFPESKPPAFLTIVDRGWIFKGVWPSMEQLVRGFLERCNCGSGECWDCFLDIIDETLVIKPTFRYCNCGSKYCATCNYYLSLSANATADPPQSVQGYK